MEIPPDTLETVGVNELLVPVTVDVSFTTEQTVVGHIDEIHILNVVRTSPIAGYLSPSQICDNCVLLRVSFPKRWFVVTISSDEGPFEDGQVLTCTLVFTQTLTRKILRQRLLSELTPVFQ